MTERIHVSPNPLRKDGQMGYDFEEGNGKPHPDRITGSITHKVSEECGYNTFNLNIKKDPPWSVSPTLKKLRTEKAKAEGRELEYELRKKPSHLSDEDIKKRVKEKIEESKKNTDIIFQSFGEISSSLAKKLQEEFKQFLTSQNPDMSYVYFGEMSIGPAAKMKSSIEELVERGKVEQLASFLDTGRLETESSVYTFQTLLDLVHSSFDANSTPETNALMKQITPFAHAIPYLIAQLDAERKEVFSRTVRPDGLVMGFKKDDKEAAQVVKDMQQIKIPLLYAAISLPSSRTTASSFLKLVENGRIQLNLFELKTQPVIQHQNEKQAKGLIIQDHRYTVLTLIQLLAAVSDSPEEIREILQNQSQLYSPEKIEKIIKIFGKTQFFGGIIQVPAIDAEKSDDVFNLCGFGEIKKDKCHSFFYQIPPETIFGSLGEKNRTDFEILLKRQREEEEKENNPA